MLLCAQRKAFERERELYRDPTLRAMMPATHAIIDNDASQLDGGEPLRAPNGMVWPPCIIIERGESLDEWARRETPDFITVMQARPSSAASRALLLLFLLFREYRLALLSYSGQQLE